IEPPAMSKVPQGQGFTVNYVLQNLGDVPSPQFRVRLSLVGGPTPQDLKTDDPEMVGPLAPGAPFNHFLDVRVSSTTPPGVYQLKACADLGKRDRDEDNNCKTSVGTVQVTARPDLLVKAVTVTGVAPITVEQGKSLIVKVVVRNEGDKRAKASTMK